MRFEKWQVAYAVFPTLILLHLFVSPYTKVEESFNLQATHDMLTYGVPTDNVYLKFKALFDHMTFPGAVPRTFIGAVVLSGAAKPLIWLGGLAGRSEQLCVRAVLGMLNASALVAFSSQVSKAYGSTTALWYIFYQASQFHVLYYASRTLPNMFAFCLSTFALAALLPVPSSSLGPVRRLRLGFYLLTLATVVFRSELALLIGSQGLWLLCKSPDLQSRLSLIRGAFVPSIVSAAMIGLVLSIGIDTYFWQSKTWIWPELSAFISNVFPAPDGQGASAWGTSAWYWYFVSAVPRLLMTQTFLITLRFGSRYRSVDGQILDVLVPSLVYTGLYSFLPHKETRFLFPIVPLLTLAAALSASWYTQRMEKSAMNRIWVYIFVLATVINGIISHAVLLPLSSTNYAGGEALRALHTHHASLPRSQQPQSGNTKNPLVHVHLTNLALQSGVTLFLEQLYCPPSDLTPAAEAFSQPLVLPGSPDGRRTDLTLHPKPTASPSREKIVCPKWIYDKTSNDTMFLDPTFWPQFDYAIVEDPGRAIGAWEIIKEIKSLGRPKILRPNEKRTRLLIHPSADAKELHSQPSFRQAFNAVYGKWLGDKLYVFYTLAHDMLRDGAVVDLLPAQLRPKQVSLTAGYWFEWEMETKLCLLKASHSGVKPNTDAQPSSSTSSVDSANNEEEQRILGLPHDYSGDGEKNKEIYLDTLGPMVVNKDGTLSRIDNWKDMTEHERATTIAHLRKRNQLRLDNVEAGEQMRTE